MTFAFTAEQINDIQTALDAAEAFKSAHPGQPGAYVAAYNLVFGMITDVDANGHQTPKSGVDAGAWVFLRGVPKVNANDTTDDYNNFIRAYTKIQYEARFHTPASDQQVQDASDGIAKAILEDIVSTNNTSHQLSDIDKIANFDASVAAEQLFTSSQIAGWAGNPFLVPVGHTQSYQTNILHAGTGDTYDIMAMLFSMGKTAYTLGFTVTTDLLTDILTHVIPDASASYLDSLQTIQSIASATDTELQQAYGISLVYAGAEALLQDIHVGTIQSDASVAGSDNSELFHAGDGDDTVTGGLGNDLIDGGSGQDALDYSGLGDVVYVTIKDAATPLTTNFIGTVFKGGIDGTDSLFNIEKIIGSSADDEFIVQNFKSGVTLDGGDGTGDRLSTFLTGTSTVFDAAHGTVSSNGVSMNIKNFERFEGTNANDTLIGGEGDDTLTGGSGNDSMDGGAGADVFDFSGAYGKDVVTDGDEVSSIVIDGEALGGTATFDFTAKHWVLEEHPNYYLSRAGADMVLHKTGDAANTITLKDFAMGESRYGIDIPLMTFEYRTTVDASLSGGNSRAPVIVSYSFDPGLAAASPGIYAPLDGGTLALDGQIFSFNTGSIHLQNYSTAFFNYDSYEVWFGGGDLVGPNDDYFRFRIGDGDGTMFTGTELPNHPGFAQEADHQGTLLPPYAYGISENQFTDDTDKTPYQLMLAGDTPALLGTSGDDTLAGGSGADTVLGGGGADSVSGNGGTDALLGGGSNDTMNGGSGNDSLEGGAENDSMLGGSGNDAMLGQQGNDYLSGNAGDDTLEGGDGDDNLLGDTSGDTVGGADILIGGAGKDTLYGGAGADVFKFLSLTDSTETAYDRIKDFVEGTDKIDLTGLGYTGVVTSGAAAGELRLTYSAASNRTYVRDDYSPFEFYLDGNHTATLHDSDFIFA